MLRNRIVGYGLGVVGYVCLLIAFYTLDTWPGVASILMGYLGLFLITVALFLTDTIERGGVSRW